MAAGSVVPARRRTPRGVRGDAAMAAARTAPRGTGLAPVVPLPVRDSGLPSGPSVPAPTAATRPNLTVVMPAARRCAARTRRRVLGAVVAAVVLAVIVTHGASHAGESVAAGHVVLQPGETLWDVAVRSAPAGVDPRQQVDALRRLNGFGSQPLDAWTVVLIPGV